MKRRKATQFYAPNGAEIQTGDCPNWIAAMRRTRPDLRERTVVVLGRGPWPCWDCKPS